MVFPSVYTHTHTEAWSRQGTLTLRVAFSRDQDKKIYVQDLIREDAEMTWNLIKVVHIT